MLRVTVKTKLSFRSMNSDVIFVAAIRAEALSTYVLDDHCASSARLT